MDQITGQLHPSTLVQEAWYQNLMKTAIDWAWEATPDGRFVYSNNVCKELLGLSPDEIIGRSLIEFVVDEEKERVKNEFARIAAEQIVNGKMRNHFKSTDGSTNHLDTSVRPYFDENGNLGFHGVSEDTNKVEAREKLWKSKAMHSAIEDVTPGLLLADHDDYIRKINRAQLNVFGIEHAENVLNTLVTQWVHPDDRNEILEKRRMLISNEGSRYQNETRIRLPDGTDHWIRCNIVSLSDNHGYPNTLFCVEDITNNKLAEAELRNSEERYRNLVEMSPSGVLVHREGGIIFANRAALEILNIEKLEDAVGKSVFDFVGTDYRQASIERARLAMIGPGTKRTQIVGVTLGGNTLFIEYESKRIIYEKEPALMVVFTDITDRKMAEEALRKTNRTLRVLSEVNETLIRAKNERELLEQACRIIVDVGGYYMAWVGFAENDEQKRVRPAASAGHVNDYLRKIKVSWDDTEYGRGPAGTSIRTGLPSFSINILTDPFYGPWRDIAYSHGYLSSIAVPLTDNERSFGTLCLYSDKLESYEEEEVKLLMELAGDISYGIMSLRLRDELISAEYKNREFYQRTILAATKNKLMICDKSTIERMGGPPISTWEVMHKEDPRMIREVVAGIAKSAGMHDDRISDFVLAVGEATTNALKHAQGGLVSLHNSTDGLLIVVSDNGPGIEAINLPEVALKKGYSTAVSLGMGYKAMIAMADRVYLSTGPEGTTVGIDMKIHQSQEPDELLSDLKDTW